MPAISRRIAVALVALLTAGLLGVLSPSPAAADSERGNKGKYRPPLGATFSNPLNGKGRAILREVFQAVYNSPKGSTIRFVVWNYDEPGLTRALIAAKKRGVRVQVVVAESVRNRNFSNLRAFLQRNPNDQSFAMRCHNACRSDRFVMHSKIFLFSKTGTRKHLSMIGSTNLTVAAGNRQWNDQFTTDNSELYRFFVSTFKEYAADRAVAEAKDGFDNGRFQVSLWPAPTYNPVAEAFDKVACHSPRQKGPTRIRIAIAGWFDQFGVVIAREIRSLWDRGCDIRIITTLTGRKIHRVLRKKSGRGRVPIRTVTIDKNRDGEPERYLHMKAVAIRGVYDGKPNTGVVFTGSPNWSGEARAADEVFMVIRNAKNLLAERGFDPVLGARPLRRTVQREIEDVLAEKMLYGEVGPGQIVLVDVEGEGPTATFTFAGQKMGELPDLPPFETAEVNAGDAPAAEQPDDSDSGSDVPKATD